MKVGVALLASLSILASGLPECVDEPTFAKNYVDESTGAHMVTGQCVPSTTAGAYYTEYIDIDPDRSDTSDKAWMCVTKDAPQPLTDAAAIANGFKGACIFGASTSTMTPDEVPLCSEFLNHNPLDCGPGPKQYWGACVTEISERWLCIDRNSPEVRGFAKGDCVARQVREDQNGHLYDNVCRFALPENVREYKCDTVSTYSAADAGTCGGIENPEDQYEACFSLKKGTQWQCLAKDDEQTTPCDWTATAVDPSVFYDGKCQFPNAPGYDGDDSNPTLAPPITTTTTTEFAPGPGPAPPAPSGGDDGGVAGGWIVVIILLMVVAAGGFFYYWRRAPARQPLIGGVEPRGY